MIGKNINSKCVKDVRETNLACLEDACRYWINYSDDLNCTHIAIHKHGAMKLKEIGDRMHLTAARIKQIETDTLKKTKKRLRVLNNQEI